MEDKLMKACEKEINNWHLSFGTETDRITAEFFKAGISFMSKPEHMKHTEEVKGLIKALEFYADPENRSATLIDEHDFKDKYFKRGYIVDVMEAPYLKDNGNIAIEALKPFEKEGGE